ncbi:hypothetical protein TNCV_2572551 [Trichonephila clavipes]|nr:hypothetical protein TNCV_2572551 [Trichonephila clavipes]
MMLSRCFRRSYMQLNDLEHGSIVRMCKDGGHNGQYASACNVQTQLCKGADSNGSCKELINKMKTLGDLMTFRKTRTASTVSLFTNNVLQSLPYTS